MLFHSKRPLKDMDLALKSVCLSSAGERALGDHHHILKGDKMEDSITLTRKEIGDAIILWIGIHKGVPFSPYYITDTDTKLHIPEKVRFDLEYVPRGSLSKDYPHNI